MKLYTYQEEAIEKMAGKDAFLLADDPGLGKTVMALEELPSDGQTLIVCPNTVKSVWVDHIEQLRPGSDVLVVNGKNRAEAFDFAGDFLIINWEALRVTAGLYNKTWDRVIADEAHYAKNRKAQRTKYLKKIRTKSKRALTGTPVINRPDELWSLLNWLYPREFRGYWPFFEKYVEYRTIYPWGYKEPIGPKNVEGLQKLIAPFFLRRLKKDVLKELPDKYYEIIKLSMYPEQRKAYEEMRKTAIAWLESHDPALPLEAPTVLAQLTRLRQFAAAYARFDDDGSVLLSEPSAKLDALMDIIEPGQPVVVFSQFKQMIYLAHQRLTDAGIPHGVLTGDTPESKRGQVVKDFQDGVTRVFLATLGAGGVGVTLHRASTAVFLDQAWSPALNLQAEDRLHRVGQHNAVQVIILQSENTVDQYVAAKLQTKWKWIREMLGDA